jgi:hypothetical protein
MENATKLAINLSEGTVQVEGSEEFVRFIYQDFRDSLSKQVVVRPFSARSIEANSTPPLLEGESKAPKRSARKTSTSGSSEKQRSVIYKPKFNTQLDLSGLEQLFDEWKPENNFEKILIFAAFLRDKLNIAPCSADDIYTCFATLNRKGKTKIPEAFVQAFRDAQHRTHYIEFKSLQEIEITIPGDNRLNEKSRQGSGAS